MRGFLGRVLARRMLAPATLAVAALLLALPTTSNARKLQMSGTWAIRWGAQIFIPLQFASPRGGTGRTFTTGGELSMGRGTPNGPIPGGGVVTATGSGPATLVVPQHLFQTQASALLPFKGVTLVQLTTMFAIDGPFEEAVLAPGGGPGTFTWCPNDVLGCPATGLPIGGVRNGRVIYRAGANRFGGSMRVGLATGGVNSYLFRLTPFQIGHAYFGAIGTIPRAAVVGDGMPSMAGTGMLYFPPGIVTQPTMAPTPDGLILYPGPKVSTMLGLTSTGLGQLYRLPPIGFSTMGMSAGQITSSYGFGHTTGTVIVQQTVGSYSDQFFTVMGYDARTPLGAGNIATVAGGISYRNTLAGQTPYTTWHKVWFSLAPPVPSLSPAGAAAAGALLMLAVGYALRRKVGR